MPISVQCKRCAHLIDDWCKPKKDSPDPDILRICQFFREATNDDRIRAMSVEELAEEIAWLVVVAFDQVVPEWNWKIDRDNRIAGTAKDILDWLQSPAERGDHDD